MPDIHRYKSSSIPSGLTFDEASLFWRLRMGEGMPSRKWHKPLDRSKSWHEIKAGLDSKMEIKTTASLFRKIFPFKNGFFARFFSKFIRVVKQSCLID